MVDEELMNRKTVATSNRDSTPRKGPRATLSPRKSPRLIEKAKKTVGVSLAKMVLDFENHVEEPTQASSQGIVNLNDDSLGTEFWKSTVDKVDIVEEAVNVTKESVLHLQNLNAYDFHPDDQPWSQPLIYIEGEDDADWKEFLHNFSMKSSAGKDSGEDDEDDNYNQLLETDDEVEGSVGFSFKLCFSYNDTRCVNYFFLVGCHDMQLSKKLRNH
ncbi:hypothetical protein MKW98_020353 [Papaver atlanticum]|uniref:Uncharacterized protein n=1 Tax=Papaver atlanticum TaxID=357466 RepID=A0AAD4RVM5_9MAGN|nr:hypothetical protein MKW98_020353 [Papaver atlanticum]